MASIIPRPELSTSTPPTPVNSMVVAPRSAVCRWPRPWAFSARLPVAVQLLILFQWEEAWWLGHLGYPKFEKHPIFCCNCQVVFLSLTILNPIWLLNPCIFKVQDWVTSNHARRWMSPDNNYELNWFRTFRTHILTKDLSLVQSFLLAYFVVSIICDSLWTVFWDPKKHTLASYVHVPVHWVAPTWRGLPGHASYHRHCLGP